MVWLLQTHESCSISEMVGKASVADANFVIKFLTFNILNFKSNYLLWNEIWLLIKYIININN